MGKKLPPFVMRMALVAAALLLASVAAAAAAAETLRHHRDPRQFAAASTASFAYPYVESLSSWKHIIGAGTNTHNSLVDAAAIGAKSDAAATSTSDDATMMHFQPSRNLQELTVENICKYQKIILDYDCDCRNWINGFGSFECADLSTNTTIFGLPVAASSVTSSVAKQEGDQVQSSNEFCVQALDETLPQADLLQSYCVTSYATSLDATYGMPLFTTCNATFNNEACDSCTMSKCNGADVYYTISSVDCSNVNSQVVLEHICEGENLATLLFSENYPTSEPTSFPTFDAAPTLAPATINGLSKVPTVSVGSLPPTIVPDSGSSSINDGPGKYVPNESLTTADASHAVMLSSVESVALMFLATGVLGFGSGLYV